MDYEAAMPHIQELGHRLIDNRQDAGRSIVVPFVGAGPSTTAGLPTADGLATKIRKAIDAVDKDMVLHRWLLKQTQYEFGKQVDFDNLDLFQLSHVLSDFAAGTEIINKVVKAELDEAKCMPLAYELLAHLAKHRFIDHAVSLNFDDLLDMSLHDELAERLEIVTRGDNLPGPHRAIDSRNEKFYLFKPFGSLTSDTYALTLENLTFQANRTVWQFILDEVLTKGDVTRHITLVVIGYQGAEPAFGRLMAELGPRSRDTFLIDSCDQVPVALEHHHTHHIKLDANEALSLLVGWMKHEWESRYKLAPWTPVARHEIVSAVHAQNHPAARTLRFKLEIILQAVKSRGFLTLESIDQITRIGKYGEHKTRAVLDELVAEKILQQTNWSGDDDPAAHEYRKAEDYWLVPSQPSEVAQGLLKLYGVVTPPPMRHITVDAVAGSKRRIPQLKQSTLLEYVAERVACIQAAPEIEIERNSAHSTKWMFYEAKPLASMEALVTATAECLEKLIPGTHLQARLYAIWTTGEWLFHPQGWAASLGERLLQRMKAGQLQAQIILARRPDPVSERQTRAAEVRNKLESAHNATVSELNWWALNRIMTLVEYEREGTMFRDGIYMRRRHATPLVAPVYVSDDRDTQVLLHLFHRYEAKVTQEKKGR
jgi:hypothetical protein